MSDILKQYSSVESAKRPAKRRYFHPCVGYGDYVREYDGPYGKGLIIRLDNGREWFAPIHEFTRVG